MVDRCLLYYITDRGQFRGDEKTRCHLLLAKIVEATRADVDYIQLRERDLGAKALAQLARDALEVIRNSAPLRTHQRGGGGPPRGRRLSPVSTGKGEESPDQSPDQTPELRTRLLINSRTDVALAVGADGVHLRADDISPIDVRGLLQVSALLPLTTGFLVTASCRAAEDVMRAEAEKADFAVFAPVFAKSSAPGVQPTGHSALREACRATIPVLALGGVTVGNAAACLEAGAAGIAGIRLFQENKIEDVVRALRTL